jgi:hypothetical protein
MNDANNVVPTCQHLFILMPIGSDGKPLRVAAALGSWPAGVFCQHCLQPAGVAQEATPNAPVEPAGLRSLRHLLTHMPDKDLHLRRFDAQQLLQFIDAILAVRLDEAAIRKDEREKCDSYRNALLWAFDRLSVTGGLDVDTQRRTMREIGNVLTGRTSPAATYQPNDDDDSVKLTSAIRSGGKQS